MRYLVKKANQEEIPLIQDLIFEIYPATYGEILEQAQIDFMLDKSYSAEGLLHSMNSGQDFYLLYDSAESPLGFIALQHKEDVILRIEKLYMRPLTQGKGLGKLLIDFAEQEAKQRQRTTLELNVNRNNKAYYFYLKQGFTVIAEVDIPYYGFVLDDYILQKKLD